MFKFKPRLFSVSLSITVSLEVDNFPYFQLSYCELAILVVCEHICKNTFNWYTKARLIGA